MYQLPAGVRPTAYRITAAFSVSRRTFAGRVRITLAVSRPTRRIYLNAKGLELSDLSVVTRSGSSLPARLGQTNQNLGVSRSGVHCTMYNHYIKFFFFFISYKNYYINRVIQKLLISF